MTVTMNLHLAILKGDFTLARRLVESGVDVNERDGHGWTPLMLCSLHDGESWALGVGRMLLVHGGRVGLADAHGRSALIYAILYKRLPLVELLLQALDYDLRRTDRDGHNALWYADQSGDDAIRKMLLQKFNTLGYEKASKLTMVNPIKGQGTVQQTSASSSRSHKPVYNKHFQKDKSTRPQSRDISPYKTLPANLWTKKATANKALGMCINHGSKLDFPSRKGKGKMMGSVGPPPVKDWSLSVRQLTGLLQDQLSPSYRPRAQPLPKTIRPRRRLSRFGAGLVLETSLRQRRQRGRKMSLGAIDDTRRVEGQHKGEFRRRCSVAVIPMIRLQATCRRPSMPLLENLKLASEIKATRKPTGKKETLKKKV